MDKEKEIWVNYAISLKMPIEDIKDFREYIKSLGYYIIFDDYALEGLRIIKNSPSGSRNDGDNFEEA